MAQETSAVPVPANASGNCKASLQYLTDAFNKLHVTCAGCGAQFIARKKTGILKELFGMGVLNKIKISSFKMICEPHNTFKRKFNMDEFYVGISTDEDKNVSYIIIKNRCGREWIEVRKILINNSLTLATEICQDNNEKFNLTINARR